MRKIVIRFLEDSNTLSLVISDAGITTENGWLIEPCSRCQVKKKHIIKLICFLYIYTYDSATNMQLYYSSLFKCR